MCIVSNIGDTYRDSFPGRWPTVPIQPYPSQPVPFPDSTLIRSLQSEVSKTEFEALKKEVEELKKLLLAAKEYDKNTGQPDCHMDEKVEFIKKLAEYVGVDIKEVFGK